MGPVSFDAIDRAVTRAEALVLAGHLKAAGLRVDMMRIDDEHHRFMVRTEDGERARALLDAATDSAP